MSTRTLNAGSQPTEQDRPAHPASLPRPCPGRSHRKPTRTPPTSRNGIDETGGAVVFHTGYKSDRVDLRHRPAPAKITRGPGSRAAGLAMAFKLIEAAQDRWRAGPRSTSRSSSASISIGCPLRTSRWSGPRSCLRSSRWPSCGSRGRTSPATTTSNGWTRSPFTPLRVTAEHAPPGQHDADAQGGLPPRLHRASQAEQTATDRAALGRRVHGVGHRSPGCWVHDVARTVSHRPGETPNDAPGLRAVQSAANGL